MTTVAYRRTLWYGLVVLMVMAFGWWVMKPPGKAHALKPLIADLNQYAIANGRYPTQCLTFSSYTQLAKNFRVYTGSRDSNGVAWDPFDVSRHDFTVLVETNGYELFLPTGRIKHLTFSSFSVYRYDSTERRWRNGRIHWSLLGAYWSKD
jgi:hypothetical protein